ncbi:hypothetical protein N0V90_008001 [Kalmusia sp. IMI 367209]|nr:hypothetical protein N0V90_008001 [Kalmusia sp. IMI 367209]
MDNTLALHEGLRHLSPFVYKRLDSAHEIRVLVLHPAASLTDQLEAHLDTRTILHEDCIPSEGYEELYEAVSYCWGADDRVHDLVCDGHLLKVTHSLNTLLRYFRKKTRCRRLWADAVCINQEDLEEKGVQVQLMGLIFSGAVKVHAWLGEALPEDEIPRLFACIVNYEPKDRVMSLLAMALPLGDSKIVIDYSKHWVEIFADVVKAYIDQDSFHTMSEHLYAFGSLHQQNNDWPSWVPAWNLKRSSCHPLLSNAHQRQFSSKTTRPDPRNLLVWTLPVNRAGGPDREYRNFYNINWSDYLKYIQNTHVKCSTMCHMYSILYEPTLEFDCPNSKTRAVQLSQIMLGAIYGPKACSEESIKPFVPPGSHEPDLIRWRMWNGFDSPDILKTEGAKKDHFGHYIFQEDETMIFHYWEFFQRRTLCQVLENFRFVMFQKSKTQVIPCLLPASIQPGDCILQVRMHRRQPETELHLILRPVDSSKSPKQPAFRLVGLCYFPWEDENENAVDPWRLRSEPKIATLQLEKYKCDRIDIV